MLRSIASQWRGLMPHEDAYREAVCGMLTALDNYNPEAGCTMSRWIFICARKAVQVASKTYLYTDQYVDECTAKEETPDTINHGALLKLLLNACGVQDEAAELLITIVTENVSAEEAGRDLNLSPRAARALYGYAVWHLREWVQTEPRGEHGAGEVLPE